MKVSPAARQAALRRGEVFLLRGSMFGNATLVALPELTEPGEGKWLQVQDGSSAGEHSTSRVLSRADAQLKLKS